MIDKIQYKGSKKDLKWLQRYYGGTALFLFVILLLSIFFYIKSSPYEPPAWRSESLSENEYDILCGTMFLMLISFTSISSYLALMIRQVRITESYFIPALLPLSLLLHKQEKIFFEDIINIKFKLRKGPNGKYLIQNIECKMKSGKIITLRSFRDKEFNLLYKISNEHYNNKFETVYI